MNYNSFESHIFYTVIEVKQSHLLTKSVITTHWEQFSTTTNNEKSGLVFLKTTTWQTRTEHVKNKPIHPGIAYMISK